MDDAELYQLAEKIGTVLAAKGDKLATAESCTGGWVAQTITTVAGSSAWFDRGFVTYSNEAKQEMLGVQASTLGTFGAVSEETAREMAEAALNHSAATVSLAVTGIAGPDGGSDDKPVGTVWFAWAQIGVPTVAKQQLFTGNRQQVRLAAVEFVLTELLAILGPAR